MSGSHDFPVLIPRLQVDFSARLAVAEANVLLPALLKQVSLTPVPTIDQELHRLAPTALLQVLRAKGVAGELVFAVPCLLTGKPSLLGYYRLLLGFSQKEFYKAQHYSLFCRLEQEGVIPEAAKGQIEALCRSLIASAAYLVERVPEVSQDILHALTLLTLGSQFRGSYSTSIGQAAIDQTFALIRSIVEPSIQRETPRLLEIRDSAGRLVRVQFASDPDIAIRHVVREAEVNRIAIEIKGGTDYSNIHNRLGEAEKSHQKAKSQGYTQFWTVVNVLGLDEGLARRESPTTTDFFILDQILDPAGVPFRDFRDRVLRELNLPS